ncbi:MAG TPA: branched-chain amino acid ABC transporter permease [Solirubrobacteraceae bacterium]|nr:branched-chain amino acid ABC transporter permease [Solirubrobacteraceae bacterium]
MSETVHSGPGGGPEASGAPSAPAQPHGDAGGGRWNATRVVLVAIAAVVVIWIAIKAADNFSQFVTVTLNGLSLSALYFVVASGFTLIFGLMRVVNMAHGTLYLLGGYLALNFQQKLFQDDSGGLNLSLSAGGGGGGGEYNLIEWIIPLAMAVIIIGVLGIAIQQLFLRWNQGQDLRQALITIAISVVAADQMLAAYGGIAKDIKAPSSFPESVHLGSSTVGFFRLVIVVGSALLIGLGLWLLFRKTRYGKIVRAGVDDRDMVSALGINVQLVFAGAFFIGAMLAGYGGVLGGTMLSLQPGEDTSFLLNSLIVVIIGGMGSLGGAAIGALALGLVDAYADVYLIFGDHDLTNYSILLTFALLVVVLAVRPLGLFGRPA